MFLLNLIQKSTSKIKEKFPTTFSPALTFHVALENDKLGNYLTDGDGRALYYFGQSKMKTLNVCPLNEDSDYLGIWQICYRDRLIIPANLKKKDFSIVARPDNRKQIFYKGNPLYYYANDRNPGDVKGEGINNNWFAVKVN